ncbi:MAG: TonB-dependent receptor, partial [Acidobacteriaceae bacterium]|nr:TonB-dependent receptor [Acidobacteriaceae bacterium]
MSAIRVNGSEGSNEFTLNGLPDTGKQIHFGGNVVGFVPPSDAVQEFKMTTSRFTAVEGHTSASTIDVSTKSGTNSLHGTAYDFYRNDLLSANDFFSNRAGQPRQVVRYNRFGGSIGGPVFIPKIYDGRNHTFFFFAYENLPDVFPEHGTFTVPTAAERQGDFSALLPLNDIIYDPLSAQPVPGPGGHVQRTPFGNNVIPASRLNPIAQAWLNFYPLPNQAGKADGTNNYYSPQPRTDRFHSELTRIDHNIGDRQRLSGTYFSNWRRELRFDWAPAVNGVATGQNTVLINHGVTLEDVVTISPSTLLDVRSGLIRLQSQVLPSSIGFDPATLGFSPEVTSLFRGPSYLPGLTISGYTTLDHDTASGSYGVLTEASNTYTLVPTLTKVMGGHTLHTGYEFRVYQDNYGGLGNAYGLYSFSQTYTRQSDTSTSLMGQGLAAFLLGQPTGGSIDRTDTRANQALYHAVFFQDDWKASRKLTLNLGLRYEFETPTTERYNRNSRGFDLTDPNPVQAAARAAFAKAFPLAGQPAITPTSLTVTGGYLFASSSNPGFWHPDPWNFEPRIGVAYQLDASTVIRGGWAIYAVPFQISGVNQPGFSQTTQLSPSNDNGLHFAANLANPFPGGVVNPSGSSLGMATALGQSASFMPLNPTTGHSQQWTVDIQRQLPGMWIMEAAYVGSRGY